MSYDVGFAKPDRRIFDAAENMADQLAAAQDAASHGRAVPWVKVYVGDEYENDVVGAQGAGWNPVFVGTEEGLSGKEAFSDLEKLGSTALDESFTQHSGPVTIRAESTQRVLEWLIEQYAR
jgi:FMN phosphatase YigB (HAD superfamily)